MLRIMVALLLLTSTTLLNVANAAPIVKPLWSKGRYYGGFPTLDKYLTQGIIFDIAPDKITMKEISIEFPADCYDENGNVSPRSIHFSPTGIEPITMRRTDQSQSLYFAYLDEFDRNWNTQLRVKWSRNRQSFSVQINSISDEIEGTYCKASAILSNGAKKGRIPSN